MRVRKTWDSPQTRKWLYRGFQTLWVAAGTAIVYGLPEPIFVVQIASVLALLFSPVLFWLNIRAIKDNFRGDDLEFMPSRFMFAWAWAATIGLAVLSVYVLYLQFLT